ncbi:MAG: GNAT family N-acetyltransferase, partial [Hyphomicrobiaceae bacterium]
MSVTQDDTGLKTERLWLRRIHGDDAAAIAELLGNWNVAKMLAKPPYPYHLADAQEFIERQAGRENSADDCLFAIESDGALAGVISLAPRDDGALVGYWLGEPYWGRGIATEALGAIVDMFFEQSRKSTLHSGVLADNPASLAVQRKVGFEVVGESEVHCRPRDQTLPHIDTQ